MTYNSTPRRRFTKRQRAAFLERHGRTCYWCKEPILEDQPWDIEHMIARELLPDGSADDDDNLAPIHSHPATCHKIKSRIDKAAIAKSNRIRRENGPIEQRKKRAKIASRGFRPGAARPMQSRNTFQKRGKHENRRRRNPRPAAR